MTDATSRRSFLRSTAGAASVPLALGAASLPIASESALELRPLDRYDASGGTAYRIVDALYWTPPRTLGLRGVKVVTSIHAGMMRNVFTVRVTAEYANHCRDSICKVIEVPNSRLNDPLALAKLWKMLNDPLGFFVVAEACMIPPMNWGTYE